MEQTQINTTKQEDATVLVWVAYQAKPNRVHDLKQVKLELETSPGHLLTSVGFESSSGTHVFSATLNPTGSEAAVLNSLLAFRDYAEKISGTICCINLDGLKQKPSLRRSHSKPRKN